MKKIYGLVLAGLLAIGGIVYAQIGDTVFSQPTFSSAPADGPGDGTTWTKLNGGAYGSVTFAYWASANALRIWSTAEIQKNDFLVSPKLDLEAGKTYKATCDFYFHASDSKAEHVALAYTSTYPSLTGENNLTILEEYNDINGNSRNAADTQYLTQATELGGKFVAREGDNYLTFIVSGAFKQGIYVKNFQVVEAEPDETTNPGGGETEEPGEEPGEDTGHQYGSEDCIGKQVPYASGIALTASTYDEEWTIIDHNNDTKKWAPTTSGGSFSGFSGPYMYLTYSSTNVTQDDYLISPAIHLQKGLEYAIIYDFGTRGADEILTVYLSKSLDPEEILESTVLAQYSKENTNIAAVKKYNRNITVNESGDYYLAFHATSPGNKWYIAVANVQVLEDKFAPAAVSNFTATPAENPTLEVSLSWTLPTTDAFGTALGEDKTLEKIELFRDGNERAFKTIEGDELETNSTSFTDTKDYGLNAGKHTYSIIVTYSGVASSETTAACGYVGPYEPLTIPATISAAETDLNGAWKATYGEDNVSNDQSATTKYGLWFVYSNTWKLTIQSNKVSDTWLFSPEIKVETPGYYEIDLTAYVGSTLSTSYIATYLSKGRTAESEMSELAIDWTKFKTSNSTQSAMAYIAEPGIYAVAFHTEAENVGTYAHTYQISSIEVKAGKMIPNTVTELTATAAPNEEHKVTLSWTNPTESTAGTALTAGEYTVAISKLTGNAYETIATLTDGSTTYEDTAIEADGAYTYKVETYATSDETAKLDNQPTVTSGWVGGKRVAIPYSVSLTESSTDPTRLIWEAVDHNDDGKTFFLASDGHFHCAAPEEANENGKYQYDDYILSPIFTLEKGYYQLSFTQYGYYSYSDSIPMKVGLVEAESFLPERSTIIGETVIKNSTSYGSSKTINFSVEEAGDYQIVFAETFEIGKITSDHYYPGFGNTLSFKKIECTPGAATEVTVTPGEDQALTATISWINPTTSSLTGITPELTEAIIKRDGEEVHRITEELTAGEAMEWEDENVPSAGPHTYTVTLLSSDGAGPDASATAWIGGGLEPPYSVAQDTNNKNAFVNDGWEPYHPNLVVKTWGNVNGWTMDNANGPKYEKEANSSAVSGVLVSPNFEFAHTQAYKLTVTSYMTQKNSWDAAHKETGYPIDIVIGKEGTPDTWTTVGTIYVTGATTSEMTECIFYIIGDEEFGIEATADDELENEEGEGEEEGEEAAPGTTKDTAVAAPTGTQRIGLRLNQWGNSSSYLFINKFSIEKEGEPTGIENVTIADGVALGADGLHFDGTATSVRIFDLSGKLVSYQAEAEGAISTEALAKGIYIVHFNLNGATVSLKIAK